MFLKHRYGRGYHMTVVKSEGCKIENVEALIQKHVPDVELEGNVYVQAARQTPCSLTLTCVAGCRGDIYPASRCQLCVPCTV